MYKYHKTCHKSSHIWECENRSLLLKGRRRGQKNVLTELDWASPRQSSETADLRNLRHARWLARREAPPKPSSNQRSTTSREASAAGRLRPNAVIVEVESSEKS